jgi:class 3 adenylate cyclase
VLAFLPVLLILGFGEVESRRRADQSRHEWLNDARRFSSQVREATTAAFWVEALAKEYRTLVAAPSRHPHGQMSPASLPAAFRSARNALIRGKNPCGRLPFSIWAGTIAGEAGGGRPVLCRGSGLEESLGLMFRDVMESACETSMGHAAKAGKARLSRLQSLLGDGICPDLFESAQQGKPFFCVFRGTLKMGVWDLLNSPDGKAAGGFFLLIDLPENLSRFALRTLLKHPKALSARKDFQTVFLPIPFGSHAASAPILLPGSLAREASLRKTIRMLQREFRSFPPPKSREDFSLKTHFTPFELADQFCGRNEYPLYRFGTQSESAGWWYTLSTLHPTTGYLALIVSRPPVFPLPFITWAGRLGAAFLTLIGLTLVFIASFSGWSLAPRRFHHFLILWMLGIICTPITLALLAGHQTAIDLQDNLLEEEKISLHRIARRIEDFPEHMNLEITEFVKSVPTATESRRILESFFRHEISWENLLEGLWGAAEKNRVKPSFLLFLQPEQPPRSRSAPELSESFKKFWGEFFRSFAERVPGFLPPGQTPQTTNTSGISSLVSRASPNETREFHTTLNYPKQVHMGKTRFSYLGMVCEGQSSRKHLFLWAWDTTETFRIRIQKLLNEIHQRDQLGLALMRTDSPQEPMAKAGFSRLQIGRGILNDTSDRIIHRDDDLWLISPSRRFPEYRFILKKSLAPVRKKAQELRQFQLLVSILLSALGVLCAYGVAHWIGGPVVRMTRVLQEITAGNLEPNLGLLRHDELGQAGQELDRMIVRLREKRTISRFVSPHVLAVVAQGNLDVVSQGSRREVVFLSSDIRNFTGISETHPPADVFSALNTHLRAMTPIIHAHGGVVDRFIGDAIQALFFADAPASAASAALAAARDIMAAHRRLNQVRAKAGQFEYAIGIGLASGGMMVGVLGDPQTRLDFSAIGEPVKNAAHLEALSKLGRFSRIVVAPAVKALLPETHAWEPIPGNPEAFELAELIATPETSSVTPPPASSSDLASPNSLSPRNPAMGLPTPTVSGPSPASYFPVAGSGENPAEPCSHASKGAEKSARIWGSTARPSSPTPSGLIANVIAPPSSGPPDRSCAQSFEARGASTKIPPGSFATGFGRWRRFFSLSPETVLFWTLWLLPLLFFLVVPGEFQRQLREAEFRREKVNLLNDLNVVKTTFSPKVQAALQAGRAVNEVIDHLPDASSPATAFPTRKQVEILTKRFSRMPHSSWFLFQANPHTAANVPRFDGVIPQLVASGGAVFPGNLNEIGNFFEYARLRYCGEVLQDAWEDVMKDWASASFGIRGMQIRVILSESLGAFFPLSTGENARQMLWLPVLGRGYSGGEPGIVSTPEDTANDPTRLHKRFFLGALIFLLDPQDSTAEVCRQLVSDQFQTTQTEISFGEATASGSFHRPKMPEPNVNHEVWSWSDSLSAPHSLPYTISRRRPSAEGMGWGKILMRAVAPLWAILGAAWGVFLLRTKRPPIFSLQGKVFLVFLAVVFPAIGMTYLAIRQMGFEQSTKLTFTTAENDQRTARILDEGLLIGNSILCRLAGSVAEDETIFTQSDEKDAMDPVSGLPFNIAALNNVFWQFMREGFPLETIFLTIPGGSSLQFPRGDKEGAPSQRFMETLQLSSLRRLNPVLNEVVKQDIKDELILEELRDLILSHFPGDAFSTLMAAPESFMQMFWGDIGHYGYRRFLQKDSRWAMILQIFWEDRSFLLPQLAMIGDAWPRLSGHSSSLRLISDLSPALEITAPYFHGFEHFDSFSFGLAQRNQFLPPPLWEPAILARATGGAASQIITPGETGKLLQAIPGKHAPKLTFLSSAPIGSLQKRLSGDIRRLVLFLLAFLLVSLALAHVVSGHIQQPVENLLNGTRRIIAGDFHVRLPVDRRDEFGTLAQSFNQMAQELHQGSLLKSFVSDSIISASQDEALGEEVKQGKLMPAVILFSGLGNFEIEQKRHTPERLFSSLNAYLETMSGIIRRQNGEIDKFIGEKVLAVFHPHRFGGSENAALAAVNAAREMAAALSRIPDLNGLPQGIGINSGSVLVGIMGSPEHRLEMTVIGDPVNLSSRLCDFALSTLRGGIAISGPVADLVSHADPGMREKLKFHSRISVKGKSEVTEIFSVPSY